MFGKYNFKKEIIILIICIVLFVGLNYNFLDSKLENFLISSESKSIDVKRVIDGDTLVYDENGSETSVRLLGINTPEKGERFYSEAKEFLESRVLNKSVKLVYGNEKTGKYGRELAYVFVDGENINKKIVKQGYGNHYFPSGRNRYYGDFLNAWKDCIEHERNLCEYSDSRCSDCIVLKEIDKFEQETVFYNSCDLDCNLTSWSIKDEGRKRFVFPEFVLDSKEKVPVKVGNETDAEDRLYWKGEDYVWTSSGDSLFLRDREGKLVLWKIIN